MARIGESDPRWIVNDLGKEGTNVGRWHWQDQNVLEWSKTRIAEILENQIIYQGDEGNVKLGKVSHLKGEATILNRKAKLFAFYELDLCVNWNLTVQNAEGNTETICKGKLNAPALESEEDDLKTFELTVSVDDKENYEVKQLVLKKAAPAFRELVAKFLAELRAGANTREKYAEWQKEKEEKGTTSPVTPSTATTSATAKPATTTASSSSNKTVSIELIEKFRSTAAELMECFLDPQRVSAYTQSQAIIDRKVGGKFKLFNGAIEGEIKELVPGKKLVQLWRFADWPANQYSTVTMDFTHSEGETTLKLKQINIPPEDNHGSDVKPKLLQGWKQNFFIRIKGVFGFGSVIMG